MGYTPIPYPKWKYNATFPPVIVGDPTAETALGDGWVDSPPSTEPDLPSDGGAEYDPAPIE